MFVEKIPAGEEEKKAPPSRASQSYSCVPVCHWLTRNHSSTSASFFTKPPAGVVPVLRTLYCVQSLHFRIHPYWTEAAEVSDITPLEWWP